MITAKEARSIIEGDTDKFIKELDELIRSAASKGKDHIRVPYEMVTIDGYLIKFKNPAIKTAVESAGYNVRIKSEDRQLVDLWLEVTW